jgi:carboxylate-amine ligase
MIDFVDDVIDDLGSRNEINALRKILEQGTGADRQLKVYNETNDLKKVVTFILNETTSGIS